MFFHTINSWWKIGEISSLVQVYSYHADKAFQNPDRWTERSRWWQNPNNYNKNEIVKNWSSTLQQPVTQTTSKQSEAIVFFKFLNCLNSGTKISHYNNTKFVQCPVAVASEALTSNCTLTSITWHTQLLFMQTNGCQAVTWYVSSNMKLKSQLHTAQQCHTNTQYEASISLQSVHHSKEQRPLCYLKHCCHTSCTLYSTLVSAIQITVL